MLRRETTDYASTNPFISPSEPLSLIHSLLDCSSQLRVLGEPSKPSCKSLEISQAPRQSRYCGVDVDKGYRAPVSGPIFIQWKFIFLW